MRAADAWPSKPRAVPGTPAIALAESSPTGKPVHGDECRRLRPRAVRGEVDRQPGLVTLRAEPRGDVAADVVGARDRTELEVRRHEHVDLDEAHPPGLGDVAAVI